MMKTNYENIAMLLQNGPSVKIYADNFSVSNIRLLAQTAVKHGSGIASCCQSRQHSCRQPQAHFAGWTQKHLC